MNISNTPRLLAAAKEFNIGKEVLVQFLTDKGFVVSSNPSTKLTEPMYNALMLEFAQDKEAKRRRDEVILPDNSLIQRFKESKEKLDSETQNATTSTPEENIVSLSVNSKEVTDTNYSSHPSLVRSKLNKRPDNRQKRERTYPPKSEHKSTEEVIEKNLQKNIWRFYIQAKRKYIQRLSSPIKIYGSTWELKENGTLKVEIDPTVHDDELFNLIKRSFTSGGVEPKLEFKDNKLSYFTVSTANSIDDSTIEKFQEQTACYYLDFSPLPVIEGFFSIKDTSIIKFREYCLNQNILMSKDREGRFLLSLQETKKVSDFIKLNPHLGISIASNIGCVIAISPIGIIDKINNRYGANIFDGTRISQNTFSISSKAFLTNIFTEIESLFRSKGIYAVLAFNLKDCKISVPENVLNSVLQSDKSIETFSLDGGLLTLKITFNEICEGAIFFHTIYSRLVLIDPNIKFQKASIFYLSSGSVLDGFSLQENKFEGEFLQFIRSRLNNKTSIIKVSNNSISFDFNSMNEFNASVDKIKSIQKYVQIDFRGDVHKMKVKIDIANPYTSVESIVKDRFKQARTKYNEITGTLQVRNHYKYNSETQNFIVTQFKGFCEEIATQNNLGFSLNNPYEIKLFAEVNEKLKEFEENQKFQKLKWADISFNEKTIGKIVRSTYPIIELKLDDSAIRYFSTIPNENKSIFSYIQPELKGEIEKIFRLENAIEKIETESRNLPNPKVAEFIFDSSKATEIEQKKELLRGSATWDEIVFHKNSFLNDSQIRGVISSLLAKDLAIIQGPPGTGKSTAISEIIWHHIRLQPKQKILLTSETHLAVDNALEKVGKLKSNLVRPIRFGVEEDDFELEYLNNDEEVTSKVEAEGKRYSAKRIEAWALAENSNQYIQQMKDNAVQIWMNKIAVNSSNDMAPQLKDKWKDCLQNPAKELKELFRKKYLEHVNVIGATSSSIAEKSTEGKPTKFTHSYCDIFNSNKRKPNIHFEVVITDEASKATPPELLMPLLFGRKSIIVGDHRQLPPMLDENDFSTTLRNIGEYQLAEEFKKSNINESQFERMFNGLRKGSTIKNTLDTQYRMHSSINEVIQQFYANDGSGLHCGLDPVQENVSDLNNAQSRWHGLSSAGLLQENTHCIWVNVKHPELLEGTSRVNWGEIEACRRVLKLLQNANGFDNFQNHWTKDEDKEIGLISFYGKQLSHLKRMANELPDMPLRISTVDKFQGMERNIIIVSMVRSNIITSDKNAKPDLETYPDTNGFPQQNSLGFAELPNRLNVALSRAKRLLIIVGNIEHFRQQEIYENVYNVIKESEYGEIIDDYKTLPA